MSRTCKHVRVTMYFLKISLLHDWTRLRREIWNMGHNFFVIEKSGPMLSNEIGFARKAALAFNTAKRWSSSHLSKMYGCRFLIFVLWAVPGRGHFTSAFYDVYIGNVLRSLISGEKRSKVVQHLSNLGNQTMFGFLAPNGFSLWEKTRVIA